MRVRAPQCRFVLCAGDAEPRDAESRDAKPHMVYVAAKGDSYHRVNTHAGKAPLCVTLADAEARHKLPCRRCYPPVDKRADSAASVAVDALVNQAGAVAHAQPRVFVYDIEANARKSAQRVRQMACRSVTGDVAWERRVDGDFALAWRELERAVDPRGDAHVLLLAHNGASFDKPVLDRELKEHGLCARARWRFADTLPSIRRWLPGEHRYALTRLTHTCLRSSIRESNADLVAFWAPRGVAHAVAHDAAFDCLVLRAMLLTALAFHVGVAHAVRGRAGFAYTLHEFEAALCARLANSSLDDALLARL